MIKHLNDDSAYTLSLLESYEYTTAEFWKWNRTICQFHIKLGNNTVLLISKSRVC